MESRPLFVDVILPLRVHAFFTYKVPADLMGAVETGKRVIVPFGKKKLYSAVIFKIHSNVPAGYEPKFILEVLDHSPVLHQLQLDFWNWIKSLLR